MRIVSTAAAAAARSCRFTISSSAAPAHRSSIHARRICIALDSPSTSASPPPPACRLIVSSLRIAAHRTSNSPLMSNTANSAATAQTPKLPLLSLDAHSSTPSSSAVDSALLTDLVLNLHSMNALCFGSFTLKSGIQSPIYIDLRLIISYPAIFQAVSKLMFQQVSHYYSKHSSLPFSLLCGVPYTALPIASLMSVASGIPMVMRRKEGPKDYGRKREIEGNFQAGQKVLVIEEETAVSLHGAGLEVSDAVVLIDRQQGGKENLFQSGIRVHSVLTIQQMLDILLAHQRIDQTTVNAVKTFLAQNQTTEQTPNPSPRAASSPASADSSAPALATVSVALSSAPTASSSASSSSSSAFTLSPALRSKLSMSFGLRASLSKNPLAARLYALMERKKSNLCFSADVVDSAELFCLVEAVGPFIIVLKTHIDLLTDFSWALVERLEALAKKYDFLIFEDRKFADIGNTVRLQYESGVHRIVEWSHITNAHAVPGPKIIDGLHAAVKAKGKELEGQRGLLLIAQMSSEGTLTDAQYAKTVAKWAHDDQYKSFVMGFICQEAISDDPQLIHMTPGVQIPSAGVSSGDALGQQYNSPHSVICDRGSDVIIVGRAILNAKDPKDAAQSYQHEGWKAYEERIHKAK